MIKDSGEIWRPIAGYEGLYEVSNCGRIKSLRPNTKIKNKDGLMRFKYDTHGYYRVNLTKNKEQRSFLVSRLVAIAFIPNEKGLPHVGHEDDNRNNNSVANLYWTDAKENNNHNGKMELFQKKHVEKIEQIKNAISCPVRAINENTGEVLEFESMQEAQRNGFSCSHISQCCNGKRKNHGGYKWEKIM